MAELQEAFGATAILHKGGGGIYDIVVDGEMIYSKHETGRFPNDGEVVELVKALDA